MNTSQDTTTFSLKTKKQVKDLAQLRARQLGVPLGTLVNAFLREFGQTGEVRFAVAEPLSPELARRIADMQAEVARGDTYGPFTLPEAEKFLDEIPYEPAAKD
jgi:antitoxin component of RelBE/YafQ-DinJ toxin-antitoxin module